MLDTEPYESARRLVPCRIKPHAAGSARSVGDHDGSSGFPERDMVNNQLGVVSEIVGKAGSLEKRIWAKIG
jgi:hypothetical protein